MKNQRNYDVFILNNLQRCMYTQWTSLKYKISTRGFIKRLATLIIWGILMEVQSIFLGGCSPKKAANKDRRPLSVVVKPVERMNVDKVISVSGSIKAKYSAPLVFQSPAL